MSLPSKAVDRLFDRLAATYGRQWILQWEGVDPNAVKSLWSHELGAFEHAMHRIAWALENLPARCPNAIEFKALCRQAPAPASEILPAPQADPERVKAELAKLGGMRKPVTQSPGHMKDWARILIARHEAGEKIRPYSLTLARAALRTSLSPAG